MASELVRVNEEMAAKNATLKGIFDEAGPDRDFSKITSIDGDTKAKVEEIQRLNKEINELGEKRESLVAVETTYKATQERDRFLNEPVRGMVHVSGKSGGAAAETHLATLQQAKGFGDLFVESEAFTGYNKTYKQGPSVEIKGIEIKTLLTETGFAPQAVRASMVLPGVLETPRVADLIPSGATDQIAIVYMEETTSTNAAAGVSEGGSKPESALAFTERSSTVRKIATVLPVTDELFADVPAMRSYVEARMRIFLALAEDSALLVGNGTPPNLTGMLNVSGINTQAKGADPTPDAIYKAMVLIQTLAFLPPDGVIFHPLDWQDVRLLRTADGLYIWGAPMDSGPERIWGLPVVLTTAMTQNTALVGAFRTATQLFRREGVTFAVSTEHSDFFIKNQLMLRVEERLALVVYRPKGLCTVTGV